MCDCVNQVEESILNMFLKDKSQITVVGPNSSFENRLLGGSGFPLCIPVRVDYKIRRKSGKEVKQTAVYNITPEYCPFCGVKTNDLPL
jgi:hypothetical protein